MSSVNTNDSAILQAILSDEVRRTLVAEHIRIGARRAVAEETVDVAFHAVREAYGRLFSVASTTPQATGALVLAVQLLRKVLDRTQEAALAILTAADHTGGVVSEVNIEYGKDS